MSQPLPPAASPDPTELQEAILQHLVYDQGYQRAIIGLYDAAAHTLSGWLTLAQPACPSPALAHTDVIPISQDSPVNRLLYNGRSPQLLEQNGPEPTQRFSQQLGLTLPALLLPLQLRGEPVGLLLLDRLPGPPSPPEQTALAQLAGYAGLALGGMRHCISQAQQQAITQERHRIAATLHDNVSQALYGLAYGLEACIQQLPDHPVQPLLHNLHQTATTAQREIRQTIYAMQTATITADEFVAQLHRHLRNTLPSRPATLRIDLGGQFEQWPASVRQHLYQVAQEAVINAAKHAGASQVVVKLYATPHHIELRIADDGDGFDPAVTANPERHLGLKMMTDRVTGMQGHFEINSAFGEGTLLIAKIPYTTQKDRL